jgi:hypothetical protein
VVRAGFSFNSTKENKPGVCILVVVVVVIVVGVLRRTCELISM